MLYYDGAMFPQLRGKLLMSWHGHRPAGSRIAAFDVDGRGVPVADRAAQYTVYGDKGKTEAKAYPGPAANAFVLTPGWNGVPGVRPRGTPVGLAVAKDGAIWVTEDINATVLRIARDQP